VELRWQLIRIVRNHLSATILSLELHGPLGSVAFVLQPGQVGDVLMVLKLYLVLKGAFVVLLL
jgi:hypothetical protein